MTRHTTTATTAATTGTATTPATGTDAADLTGATGNTGTTGTAAGLVTVRTTEREAAVPGIPEERFVITEEGRALLCRLVAAAEGAPGEDPGPDDGRA